jgi:hypothetical protein
MVTRGTPRYKRALLAATVLILVWAILGAADARNRTYTGYVTDGNNTVIQVTESSPADVAGFAAGDIIRSVGGISVEDTRALTRRPRPAAGEVHIFVVERDGQTLSLDLAYSALPVSQVLVGYASMLLGLSFLAFGVWAYLARPNAATGLLALLGIAFSVPLAVGPYFASAFIRTAVGAILLVLIILGFAVLLHFLFVFLKPKQMLERRNTIWMIYGPAIVVALLGLWLALAQPAATSGINVFFRVLFGLFIVGYFGASLIAIIHSYIRASRDDRSASGLDLILAGAVVGLVPLIVNGLVGVVAPQVVVPGGQYFFLTLVFVPVTFALAATRIGRGAAAVG